MGAGEKPEELEEQKKRMLDVIWLVYIARQAKFDHPAFQAGVSRHAVEVIYCQGTKPLQTWHKTLKVLGVDKAYLSDSYTSSFMHL